MGQMMEVWGTCQEHAIGLQEAHTVVITLFLLFVALMLFSLVTFYKDLKPNLWLFLMELYSLPLTISTVITRCLS